MTAGRQSVSYVPRGGTNTDSLDLTYNSPIDSGGSSSTSTFVGILGIYNGSSTLVGALYSAITQPRRLLNTIKESARIYNDNVPIINDQIPTIQAEVDGLRDSVGNFDDNIGTFLGTFDEPKEDTTLALYIFYGCLLFLCLSSIVVVIVMFCCRKSTLRYLLYSVCAVLTLACLVSFVAVIVLSVAVPIFTWTCDYLEVTL